MRAEIRVQHYSIRTEQTYRARRYIFFHDKKELIQIMNQVVKHLRILSTAHVFALVRF